MAVRLPLAEYRFVFRAIDAVTVPALADPLWYSVFGLALRQLSCTDNRRSCLECPLRFRCDFAFLIRGMHQPGEKNGITRQMHTIPTPLIFHSRVQDAATTFPEGAMFSARILLVGDASNRLTSVVRAMVLAGNLGLGRKRSRFTLVEVLQSGPDRPERLVMSGGRMLANPMPGRTVVPPPPRIFRLLFDTPYLLPASTDLREGFDGARMLMQVVRRISALHEPYTGLPLEADFGRLKRLAAAASFLDGDLQAEEKYSYAGNRKYFLAIRGWFSMSLSGLQDFWPWLYIGQWLHVPKQASKGFGRYRLQVLDA